MSDSVVSKISKVLSWIMMGVSILLTVLFYTTDSAELTADGFAVDTYIKWAYILFGIAVVLALVFPIYFFIKNPKNALKALLGLAAMFVVLLFGYLFADATPLTSTAANPDFSNTKVLVLTDTGLIATYILFVVALFLLLFTGVRNAIRK